MKYAAILKKFTSRKFWMAAAGVVTGIAMIFGVSAGDANTISGAIVAAASAVSYIIAEGRIDAAGAARVSEAMQDAQKAVDLLQDRAAK
jgi:drug/metabolite transporter (DMT)-like permease